MPDRYHIHTAATPGAVPPRRQIRQCRLARGLLPLQQLRQASLSLRRLPARVGLQPRPAGAGRNPGRMQSLPLLRAGLHQGAAGCLGEPGIPGHGRRVLEARALSSLPGTRRTPAGSRSPGRAIAGGFTVPVSTPSGRTCRKSSAPPATAFTGASTFRPAWISVPSRCAWSSRPTAGC